MLLLSLMNNISTKDSNHKTIPKQRRWVGKLRQELIILSHTWQISCYCSVQNVALQMLWKQKYEHSWESLVLKEQENIWQSCRKGLDPPAVKQEEGIVLTSSKANKKVYMRRVLGLFIIKQKFFGLLPGPNCHFSMEYKQLLH